MGVISAKSKLSLEQQTETDEGFHRCWYPVALAGDVVADAPIGRAFLGSRVVAYRDGAGRPVVQSAWCPHLGADLTLGRIVDGHLRCPYHHWSFGLDGHCVRIPAGDKIPAAARLFTYPAAEAWGLVWAFNGETPDYEVPRIPGATGDAIVCDTYERGDRPWDTWVAVSNGVDFQHLQTLHGLPATARPEQLTVEAAGIEFRIESPHHVQHGRITGTNVFAQHLRLGGQDLFMLFGGTPIAPGRSSGFMVVGVPKETPGALAAVRTMADRLSEEDAPVLSTMRFRRGLLTASDRHLATYFRYVESFPCFRPPA